MTNRWFG